MLSCVSWAACPDQPLDLLLASARLLRDRLQGVRCSPDIFQGIDHPQEGRYGHDLGAVDLDAAARGLPQDLSGRGVVEGFTVIEGNRPFDGFN